MKFASIASLFALAVATSADPITKVVTVTVYETFTARVAAAAPPQVAPASYPPVASPAGGQSNDSQPSVAPIAEAGQDNKSGAAVAPYAGGDWMKAMLCQVNKVRAQRGAKPLGLSHALIKTAQEQSDYQNSIGQMTHNNPAGGVGARLKAQGVSWQNTAENVAAGMKTPEQAQEAWENSSGHMKNMVNPVLTHFGAAINSKYFTQNYMSNGSPAAAADIPSC
ncbi:hypothetical protein H4R19_004441 [Coemansia spiralis]|nr:hypothetical protein H4R19_004441 [Coemansia spiralis]